MVQLKKTAALALFLLAVALQGIAQQSGYRGLALIIANSRYENTEDMLSNPARDGEAVAQRLTSLGFKVQLKKDLRTQEMMQAMDDFGHQAQAYTTAIFYYCGHGAQAEHDEYTSNYMVPVDVTVRSSDDVRKQCIDLNYLASRFHQTEGTCRQRLFFIDACRDIPSFRIVSRGMGADGSRMRGEMYDDTWVLFSTASGSRADDGNGNLSPFANAWLEATSQPGLSLDEIAASIAFRVGELTSGGQHVSLNSDNPPNIVLNRNKTSFQKTTPKIMNKTTPMDENQMTVQQLQAAAEEGNAKAQLLLGKLYEKGDGVEKNEKTAIRWYRESALLGNAQAHYYLGRMVEKTAPQEAVAHYSDGAALGDPWAQYKLGYCYSKGIGITRNITKATQWYNSSAEHGDAKLQYNVALGFSALNFDVTALKWYLLSAQGGFVKAQLYLGHLYSKPQQLYFEQAKYTDLPVNYSESAKWFRLAAEQGDKEAQQMYGRCLEFGLGVPQNKTEAQKWYELSQK